LKKYLYKRSFLNYIYDLKDIPLLIVVILNAFLILILDQIKKKITNFDLFFWIFKIILLPIDIFLYFFINIFHKKKIDFNIKNYINSLYNINNYIDYSVYNLSSFSKFFSRNIGFVIILITRNFFFYSSKKPTYEWLYYFFFKRIIILDNVSLYNFFKKDKISIEDFFYEIKINKKFEKKLKIIVINLWLHKYKKRKKIFLKINNNLLLNNKENVDKITTIVDFKISPVIVNNFKYEGINFSYLKSLTEIKGDFYNVNLSDNIFLKYEKKIYFLNPVFYLRIKVVEIFNYIFNLSQYNYLRYFNHFYNKSLKNDKEIKVLKNYIFSPSAYFTSFFHYIFEVVIPIYNLSIKYSQHKVIFINIFPNLKSDLQKLFGSKLLLIDFNKKNSLFTFQKSICASYSNIFENIYPNGLDLYRNNLNIFYINKKFVNKFSRKILTGHTKLKNNKNILFISKASPTRVIENYEEIKFHLINNNYLIDFFEFKSDLTLKKQAMVFNSYNKIIIPIGGDMTNIIFCKPKTKILVLCPEYKYNFYHFFQSLADINKLELKYCEGKIVNKNLLYPFNSSYNANIEDIEKFCAN